MKQVGIDIPIIIDDNSQKGIIFFICNFPECTALINNYFKLIIIKCFNVKTLINTVYKIIKVIRNFILRKTK
jgi:hypothetical protein